MNGRGIDMRYVALHPTRGILLTEPLILGGSDLKEEVITLDLYWSNAKDAGRIASAPTFENMEQVFVALGRAKNPLPTDEIKKLKLCEVWPEGKSMQATPEACRNAMLPSWDVTDTD